ncbi:MAG: cytochrome c [Deltaproteobacteria bacterium]|nr:cytochrome c [Deltaproteobacteria bacterium]
MDSCEIVWPGNGTKCRQRAWSRRVRAACVIVSLTLANAAAAAPVSPDLLELGKRSFTVNCVPCHGPAGHGDGVAAIALNPKPRNYVTDAFKNGDKAENVFKTIAEGIKGTPMVSYAHLPERERWSLAYYVLELRTQGQKAKAP